MPRLLLQIWLSYDYQTGQYAPAGGTDAQQQQHSQQAGMQQPQLQDGSKQQSQPYAAQPAQQSAEGSSYYERPAASAAAVPAAAEPAMTAPGPTPDPAAAPKPTVAKRRVATIGSKPQLNPVAVAEAARIAEVASISGSTDGRPLVISEVPVVHTFLRHEIFPSAAVGRRECHSSSASQRQTRHWSVRLRLACLSQTRANRLR